MLSGNSARYDYDYRDSHGGGRGIPVPSLDATSPYVPPGEFRRSPRDEPGQMPARSPREQPVQLDPAGAAGYPTPPYPPYGFGPYGYPSPYPPYPPYLSPHGTPAWPAWGPPPGPPPMPNTPYTPGHPAPVGFPPHPGYPAQTQTHQGRRDRMNDDYMLDKADKWSRPAEFRAPSLTLAELGFLAPKEVEINPLLSVGSDAKPAPALDWNLAFPQSTAKKTGDTTNRALGMDERACPATWPAIKRMTIVLDEPTLERWEIEVVGNRGGCVTVGDILTAVHQSLLALIHPAEWEAISQSQSTHVRQYWKRIVAWANFNRSTDPRAPGGHMQNTMQRIDFMCGNTIWGGLRVDPRQSRALVRHAQSGYWVFRLELMVNGIGEGSMPPPGRGATA